MRDMKLPNIISLTFLSLIMAFPGYAALQLTPSNNDGFMPAIEIKQQPAAIQNASPVMPNAPAIPSKKKPAVDDPYSANVVKQQGNSIILGGAQKPLPELPKHQQTDVFSANQTTVDPDTGEVLLNGPENAYHFTRPSILIIPVVTYGIKQKAFADLPVVLAGSFAEKLSEAGHKGGLNYGVLNPVYSVDQIEAQGLKGVYQQLVQDYLSAGQPNPRDAMDIAKVFSTDTQSVGWIAFVEADTDFTVMSRPTIWQRPFTQLYAGRPSAPNAQVKTRIQVYRADSAMPLVWTNQQTRNIKVDSITTFTGPALQAGNGLVFQSLMDNMANGLMQSLPLSISSPQLSVQGNIVTPQGPSFVTKSSQKVTDTLRRIINY